MYCKNCGTQNSDDAKFCTSCGAPIEQAPKQKSHDEYQDYFEETKNKSNYDYQESLQDGMYHEEKPENIYGKQFGATSTGKLPFEKKGSPIGKIIGFVLIVGITALAYFILFSDGGPIYDVVLGTEVSNETFYPEEPIDYVIASSGILYVSYTTRDIQYETVSVSIVNDTLDTTLYTDTIYISYDEQVGYFSYDHNWTVGSYEVIFELDGETLYTLSFEVKTE